MKILIVGAGPTGLTAAIELHRRGIPVRIIDRKAEPSPLSRAIGINAHSLDLLEACGATQALIERGIKVRAMHMHDSGSEILRLNFKNLPHRFDFLLALPQDQTEHVLIERLESYGGRVEFGTSLKFLTQGQGRAHVTLESAGRDTVDSFDLVIAADGAHSKIRTALEIPFPGFDLPTRWSIADFDCANWPSPSGHVDAFILPDGHFRFVIRIAENRFRAVADQPDTLSNIPVKFKIDKVHHADDFLIGVRQAKSYQKGCVYLAGDAAHVHSPIGGRGMNLGIDDACDLARRIAENDLSGYTAARIPVGHATINLSERLRRGVMIRNPAFRALRKGALAVVTRTPLLQRVMLKSVAGIS